MPDSIFTKEGFVDHFINLRPRKKSFLDNIDHMIDWKPIEKLLKKHYKKIKAADGRPAYPPLPLFKMLLLQRWYDLSDPGLEESVNDRLSFLRFTGFSFESNIPDETTICRFRNFLITKGLYKKLLEGINSQLEGMELLVKKGAVVDASLVSSSRRPRKVIDIMPEDREEDKFPEEPNHEVTYSDDTEAAWVIKGKHPYYGFKLHMATDAHEGFIIGGHVTPANHADTSEFEKLVDDLDLDKETPVLADKGYSSQKNREYLAQKKLTDGIMIRGARNNPLTEEEIRHNRLISRLRFIVEQGFGTLKRRYKFERTRYLGCAKTELQFYLNAMAFNLKKATAMVTV
jgi:IS5 family transposase